MKEGNSLIPRTSKHKVLTGIESKQKHNNYVMTSTIYVVTRTIITFDNILIKVFCKTDDGIVYPCCMTFLLELVWDFV